MLILINIASNQGQKSIDIYSNVQNLIPAVQSPRKIILLIMSQTKTMERMVPQLIFMTDPKFYWALLSEA